jgi:fructoselysine transporter
MNISIVSVIPWQQAKDSEFVISLFMDKLAGSTAAHVITCLILLVAFASVFSATLGYSRIPYAAAKDGAFFKVFAREHPREHFPYVSLLALGGIAFIFSLLFRLSDVISAILAMRILIQFIGQAVGLWLLRKQNQNRFPYKMPFFPWPIYIAIAMWTAILISTGYKMVIGGLLAIGSGITVYYIKNFIEKNALKKI